eukprot:11466499-Alexandrium_andersonii.AAC.1
MSASLVGSEMCIRDSGNTALLGIDEIRTPPHCGSRCRRRTHTCSASTVSYTHLTLPTICSV